MTTPATEQETLRRAAERGMTLQQARRSIASERGLLRLPRRRDILAARSRGLIGQSEALIRLKRERGAPLTRRELGILTPRETQASLTAPAATPPLKPLKLKTRAQVLAARANETISQDEALVRLKILRGGPLSRQTVLEANQLGVFSKAETTRRLRGIVSKGEQIKETALDLIPVFGTIRQARRVLKDPTVGGVALLALSALGDVTLAGAGAKAAVAAIKGVGLVARLSAPTSSQVITLVRTAAQAGKPIDDLVITASRNPTQLREATQTIKALVDDPSLAKAVKRITLEAPPTRAGARALQKTDDALRNLKLPASLDKKIRGVIRIDQTTGPEDFRALPELLKNAGVNRVTVRTTVRPPGNFSRP